ncbi:MAG: hypothetical protein KDI12_24160 [Anaerolineae bacterium]|nr:hypothetical protein [Anaerolineae bacterium]
MSSRTPVKSEQQRYLDSVVNLAQPANPFEKQLEEYAEWEELKGLIEQLRQAGYDISDTAELVKQALNS